MSQPTYGGIISKKVATSFDGKLGYAVKLDTDPEFVVLCSAKTDKSEGIVVAENIAGGMIAIATRGSGLRVLVKVTSATFSAGDRVAPTTDGTNIVTTTTGDECTAILRKAGVTGDLVPGDMTDYKHV